MNWRKKYPLNPRGKPAIGPSKRSKAAKRYYKFRDDIKRLGMWFPVAGAWITFRLPIAKSRKGLKPGDPHTQKPDLDNLLKALGDAIYQADDSGVWLI